MGTDDDDTAVGGLLDDHVLAGEQRDIGDAAQDLDDTGSGTHHEELALAHRSVERDAEDLDIDVVSGVDDDLIEAFDIQKLFLDLVDIDGAQVIQGDAEDVFGFEGAFGLLFDIARHILGGVAEGLVAGEFGLVGGDEFLAVTDVVNVVDREASAFLEERAQDLAVDLSAGVFLVVFAQDLRFERVMAAQGGVGTADIDVGHAELAGCFVNIFGDLVMERLGLGSSQAAGIGQHIEERTVFLKAVFQALDVPAGENRDVMNGLNAGRVVVEDDDLDVVQFDLLIQKRIDCSFIDCRERFQDLGFHLTSPDGGLRILPAFRSTGRFRRGHRSYGRGS